ncbi:hypothetical protein MPLA_1550010 [Mesorhizobium sp. ORS 3359]|nr:hypothetical protein MPLA_1550010 [Mesorhizobium sp. ORS 3359]
MLLLGFESIQYTGAKNGCNSAALTLHEEERLAAPGTRPASALLADSGRSDPPVVAIDVLKQIAHRMHGILLSKFTPPWSAELGSIQIIDLFCLPSTII